MTVGSPHCSVRCMVASRFCPAYSMGTKVPPSRPFGPGGITRGGWRALNCRSSPGPAAGATKGPVKCLTLGSCLLGELWSAQLQRCFSTVRCAASFVRAKPPPHPSNFIGNRGCADPTCVGCTIGRSARRSYAFKNYSVQDY